MQAMYGYIYIPNQDISDEIYEGYENKNIIDYLFDKGLISKNDKAYVRVGNYIFITFMSSDWLQSKVCYCYIILEF